MHVLQHASSIIPQLTHAIRLLKIIHADSDEIEKEYGVRDFVLTEKVAELIALLKEIISNP